MLMNGAMIGMESIVAVHRQILTVIMSERAVCIGAVGGTFTTTIAV